MSISGHGCRHRLSLHRPTSICRRASAGAAIAGISILRPTPEAAMASNGASSAVVRPRRPRSWNSGTRLHGQGCRCRPRGWGGLDFLTTLGSGTTGILDPVGRYTLRNAFGFGGLVLALEVAAEIRPATAKDDDDGISPLEVISRDICDQNLHAGRPSHPLPLCRRQQRHPVRRTNRADLTRRERIGLPPIGGQGILSGLWPRRYAASSAAAP